MQAVQFRAYGSPDVLDVVDTSEPVAPAGGVLIRVIASGVNGLDAILRQGFMAEQMPVEFPAGVGLEASGEVLAVGEGVTGTAVGDVVFGFGAATAAEKAVLVTWAAVPATVDPIEAGGWAVAIETAGRVLTLLAPAEGSTVLVSGASGGVGTALVQLAVARGLRVIGTASEANQERVTALGATAVVYGDGLADRVRATAPEGVSAAFDLAGSGIVPELIEIVGDASHVISIADFSAPEHGARVSTSQTEADPAASFAEAIAIDGFGIPVAATFPLARAGEAQELVAGKHSGGKVLLVP
ncbi:NADPH:quinone reductase-like Zn-dependent oxidoreductase [Frondihabitans sp. PhB188]|uniref:NADP-dependent oxidoreductase n=1 Tax=Frondihabitans sp. PhB188 TaxID=2485200 RepID=UPI000F465A5C|nr:NADP-dependent oxidoreductase [Frondihabitans sp. PhB188]ROQ37003.1 NADPH:quinone reductase-like Zn-dependent oxidoreductase [Frondihabitans sp. PhB188]